VSPLHLRKTAAHVSLSSIFNCQKTDGPKPVKNPSPPNPKVGQQNQHNSQFQGSCLNQSGGPCGAALSFGEAAYTATPSNRQQPFVKKLSFFSSD
jgi:hypothetical protein